MTNDDDTTTGRPPTATTPARRRRRRGGLPVEIDALADFVRALEQMSPNARSAAIHWLTDRYLDRARPDRTR